MRRTDVFIINTGACADHHRCLIYNSAYNTRVFFKDKRDHPLEDEHVKVLGGFPKGDRKVRRWRRDQARLVVKLERLVHDVFAS